MTSQQYLENLNRLYQTGDVREHSYRGDLQIILTSILPSDILVTNEPACVTCGESDSRILYSKIIVALTETDRLMKEIDNVFEI